MKLDTLDALGDVDLQAIAARCEALLKQHDMERKEKALEQARTLLASVGLSLKDVAKAPAAKMKGPVYHSGTQYAHPANKALVWAGKGKRPTWLTTLEAEGGKAVEIADDNAAPGKAANDGALKKAGKETIAI